VGAGRLALAMLAVLLCGGLIPVLGAVALSIVVGLLISGWPLREVRPDPWPATLPSARAIHGYFWGVLLGQMALFLLINADLILSPRYLTGATLAAYGKAAMFSRIVFFLPMPMITAMFPCAVTSGHPRLILVPAVLTLMLCVAAATVMTIFPALLMRLMYGVNDPFATCTLWLIPVTLGYLALLSVCHATPQAMILCLLAGGLAALLLLLGLTAKVLRAGAPAGGERAWH
ncbi:MAG: hypothetical protein NTV49_01335, partial [Kiritimatiellaeota bacterium]|nr:hypothetical protein [Kiritimatiellota bacterium]